MVVLDGGGEDESVYGVGAHGGAVVVGGRGSEGNWGWFGVRVDVFVPGRVGSVEGVVFHV